MVALLDVMVPDGNTAVIELEASLVQLRHCMAVAVSFATKASPVLGPATTVPFLKLEKSWKWPSAGYWTSSKVRGTRQEPLPGLSNDMFLPRSGSCLSKERWMLGIWVCDIHILNDNSSSPEPESHKITSTEAPGGPSQDQETLTVSS